MNNSTENILDQMQKIKLTSAEKTFVLISCAVFIGGLFANLLLIWTYASIKRLRTPHNSLVINLAVADIVILGYIMPCNMGATVMDEYPLPRTICTINGVMAYLCFTTSIASLMIIALNRYVKICKSHLYNQIFTDTFTTFAIVASWLSGCVFVIPYLVTENGILYDTTLQMCIFNRFMKGPLPFITTAIAIVLPVTITCCSYVGIYRHFQKVKSQLVQILNNSVAKARLTQNIIVTRSCFVVFITSLIAFTPFGITTTFFAKPSDIHLWLHLFSILLCFANSAVNCVIYGLMNRNIREGYKETLSCFFKTNTIHADDTLQGSDKSVPRSSQIPLKKKDDPSSDGLNRSVDKLGNSEDSSRIFKRSRAEGQSNSIQKICSTIPLNDDISPLQSNTDNHTDI